MSEIISIFLVGFGFGGAIGAGLTWKKWESLIRKGSTAYRIEHRRIQTLNVAFDLHDALEDLLGLVKQTKELNRGSQHIDLGIKVNNALQNAESLFRDNNRAAPSAEGMEKDV